MHLISSWKEQQRDETRCGRDTIEMEVKQGLTVLSCLGGVPLLPLAKLGAILFFHQGPFLRAAHPSPRRDGIIFGVRTRMGCPNTGFRPRGCPHTHTPTKGRSHRVRANILPRVPRILENLFMEGRRGPYPPGVESDRRAVRNCKFVILQNKGFSLPTRGRPANIFSNSYFYDGG